MHGVTAGAHETVKRRPIGLAKLRERGLRNLRVGLAFSGRENHAPMGRRKGVALTVDGLSQSFHVTGVSESRKKTSREKNHNSVQHRFRNPFVKGKQSSITANIYENQTHRRRRHCLCGAHHQFQQPCRYGHGLERNRRGRHSRQHTVTAASDTRTSDCERCYLRRGQRHCPQVPTVLRH